MSSYSKYKLRQRKDKIKGGRADKLPDSAFNKTQLKMGEKVEMEHTTDKTLAHEIAGDHLSEDPLYYTHLKQMEKQAEESRPKLYHFIFKKADEWEQQRGAPEKMVLIEAHSLEVARARFASYFPSYAIQTESELQESYADLAKKSEWKMSDVDFQIRTRKYIPLKK